MCKYDAFCAYHTPQGINPPLAFSAINKRGLTVRPPGRLSIVFDTEAPKRYIQFSYENGVLHLDNGKPAAVYAHVSSDCMHLVDSPFVDIAGLCSASLIWYNKGRLHSKNGAPAVAVSAHSPNVSSRAYPWSSLVLHYSSFAHHTQAPFVMFTRATADTNARARGSGYSNYTRWHCWEFREGARYSSSSRRREDTCIWAGTLAVGAPNCKSNHLGPLAAHLYQALEARGCAHWLLVPLLDLYCAGLWRLARALTKKCTASPLCWSLLKLPQPGDAVWLSDDGIVHRCDGPAIVRANGRREWWHRGLHVHTE